MRACTCTHWVCCSYAISRLDRCEGLLQEWGSYIQSAASTARSMDEVQLASSHVMFANDFIA